MNGEHTTEIVILAAGKGKRMRSDMPKVLQQLAGKPLLQHVIDTGKILSRERFYVVAGHGQQLLKKKIQEKSLQWIIQEQQLGTAHAVSQAISYLSDERDVLILYGDVPCLQAVTLSKLIEQKQQHSLALLTTCLSNPSGYGRIVRNSRDKIQRIVEEKDADNKQKAINEINTGIMLVSVKRLRHWLKKIDNHNAQGEYYLTDIVALAVTDGEQVASYCIEDSQEVQGVNDRSQLAELERYYQNRQAQWLMQQGVSLMDPQRFDLRGELSVGKDVHIDINVILKGNNLIGDRVSIGANTVIKNCMIGDDVVINDHCVLEGAVISARCEIGPFARLRPQAELAEAAKVGNFVEIKKSFIGRGSKVNHLSYIGDTRMGEDVNIGAGTITCNYDGAYKHCTQIKDKVFVGSNSALVAPVTLEKGATIGAGSVITVDVEEDNLALSRSKQRCVNSWKRPVKKTTG